MYVGITGWFTNNVNSKTFLTTPQHLKCQSLLCSCTYKLIFTYEYDHFYYEIILCDFYSFFSQLKQLLYLRSCSILRQYSWNQLLKNCLSVENITKKLIRLGKLPWGLALSFILVFTRLAQWEPAFHMKAYRSLYSLWAVVQWCTCTRTQLLICKWKSHPALFCFRRETFSDHSGSCGGWLDHYVHRYICQGLCWHHDDQSCESRGEERRRTSRQWWK